MQIELPSIQSYIGWSRRPSRSDASVARNFELRPLSAADTAEAKLLVFEGFSGDPVLEWCFDRSDSGYSKRLRAYIELVHRSHTAEGHPVQGAYIGDLLLGLVYVTVPDPPHPASGEKKPPLPLAFRSTTMPAARSSASSWLHAHDSSKVPMPRACCAARTARKPSRNSRPCGVIWPTARR